jgi:hypothetical protein
MSSWRSVSLIKHKDNFASTLIIFDEILKIKNINNDIKILLEITVFEN